MGLGACTVFLTNSITMALAVGVSSAACVWLATTQVMRQWQYRAEAFSAAAHGLPIKSAGSLEDQLDFTRDVQLAALANRENARRLKLLRAALDGLADGVWVTTEDGTVLEHNATLRKLLDAGELRGRHPREFVTDPQLLAAIDQACHQGSSLSLVVDHLRVQVAPLLDARGSSAIFTLAH